MTLAREPCERRRDRRGISRDQRCRRSGRSGPDSDGARSQALAWRRYLLLQPPGTDHRQRSARVPALLHGLPRPAGQTRRQRLRDGPGPAGPHRARPVRTARLRRVPVAGPVAAGQGAGSVPAAVAGRASLSRGRRRDAAVWAPWRRGADATLGSWLSRKGQSENARRRLLGSAVLRRDRNAGRRADLRLTVTTLRTALLAGRGSADLGVPAVPLSKLHAGPAGALLTQLGVTVLVGAQVVSIQADGGGYEVRLDRGAAGGAPRNRAVPPARDGAVSSGAGGRGPSGIHADGIVLAVPAWEAAALAPAELAAEAARWVQLQPSPVISLHVVTASGSRRLPCAAAGRLARALGRRQKHARRTARGSVPRGVRARSGPLCGSAGLAAACRVAARIGAAVPGSCGD